MCHMLYILDEKPYGTDPGVCHADDLLYLFKLDLPIVLCDIQTTLDSLLKTLKKCIAQAVFGKDLAECIADPKSDFMQETGDCLNGELTLDEQIWSHRIVQVWTNFAKDG